jgi:hypothetical protein
MAPKSSHLIRTHSAAFETISMMQAASADLRATIQKTRALMKAARRSIAAADDLLAASNCGAVCFGQPPGPTRAQHPL